MRLLLDTNAFLWLMNGSAKISTTARQACEDPTNELFLSVASVWEIQIKKRTGKLTLDDPIEEIVERHLVENDAKILPVELAHVYALGELEDHHRDPFDRLLIAQANAEDVHLVTNDPEIAKYRVNVLW